MAGMNSIQKALFQLFIFLKYSINLFIPNYLTNVDFDDYVLNKKYEETCVLFSFDWMCRQQQLCGS
jgi:hypothetical protein